MAAGPAGGGSADGRVASYLGRVLAEGDTPVGTCFQVASGVLVTAWHVLDDIGAAAQDAPVRVDPLAGGKAFTAVVARVDPVHDLAVLTTRTPLPTMAGTFTQTDRVALRTPVTVTGHVLVDDEHTYRFLDAPGEWAGGTTRDDAVPLGRIASTAVLRGMSGAPVIRDSDAVVVGVVSGRYNTTDGWLTGTVWVTRTEDLTPLLDGLADVTAEQAPLAGPVDLILTVTGEKVRLTGPGIDLSAAHGGVRVGLAEAVNEVRRARARAGLPVRTQAEAEGPLGELSLARAGQLLGESFLPGPVAAELGKVLAAAERAHQPVRLGLAVEPGLLGLPWEALPSPDGRGPLALHPLASLYRKAGTAGVRVLEGPLRIVVAIASPDTGGGPLLDYERELRNVLAEVRAARQDADVRVVPFATPAAIRDELGRGPVHVLHVSGHASPGRLDLEDEDGTARPVTSQEFLEQAIPPGKMPPVITLSACYTDAAAADGAASFAAELARRGVSAVIGTETSVTDIYATRLLARVYATLARTRDPDVIAALAAARREVQAELEISTDKRDNLLAGLGEWATVTVLAASGAVPVLDPESTAPAAALPSRPRIAGLAGREDWYFVGRRTEQRSWPADLISTPGLAGIVVYGIGGTGKTTLAAELTARVRDRDPGRVLASLTGPLTLEGVLGQLISVLRRELLVTGHGVEAVRALEVAARADLDWADRWGVLREHVLGQVPVLVVLDNFEDNLEPTANAGYEVRDEALAGLLAAWAGDPGAARLLVTSRYPFILPGGIEQFLSFRQLGALSRAETMKLAWSLPALDKLDEGQLDRVWRLAGGHPRSLEYLDALLSGGTARYPDVTARLHLAVSRRLSGTDKDRWLAARTGLDAALAETVALAADDVLLDDLLSRLARIPGAADLLLGVSVYREPVDTNAVLFQAGQPDPAAENVPDQAAAYQRITEILAAAGIAVGKSFDLASLPELVRAQLAPHLAELNRAPVPPLRPPPDLAERVGACQAASLLTVRQTGRERWFFVHRWTATELADRATLADSPVLEQSHRQAAAYWMWRYQMWPQDKAADVHDLLEARHHLLAAGEAEDAGQVSEWVCSQLHTWGAWDQEASLIHDTFTRLPTDSPRQAAWIHRLGVLAYSRGDYSEAARQYQRALDIFERLGDQAGMADTYHYLGILAHDRSDYDEAARQYQRALDIFERLGDRAAMANSYGELAILARKRSDYDEAARQYQRALDIFEPLGDQAGMATAYHDLGILAHARGDYDEAARQYQRALDIFERLGNQARMADSYQVLGNLASGHEDYHEAARQYQRALDIRERLGDQAGTADAYGGLGTLAQVRGDYDEAARQYQRALDICERLGDQARMADAYGGLGTLAQVRGDYDEAARQYQRALDIFERLGNQARMADTYSQLGILEAEQPDGSAAVAVGWQVKAFEIRLRLGLPQAVNNLHRLAAHRKELGPERFTSLLCETSGVSKLAETITSLLDQLDAAEPEDA
jgi:tetratricopeptide (TPR) repeat protein